MFKHLLEDALNQDLDLSSDLDFGKDLAGNSDNTTEPLNTPTDTESVDDVDVTDDKIKTTRVLTIDKRRINLELKALDTGMVTAIPIKSVKQILRSYKLELVDTEYKFLGRSGNADLELRTAKGTPVSNSALVIYWHIKNDGVFELNIYLS
jgi:hypothetical protein